jgi:S-adenosylmethionine:tRNA ribosyltransferase-isomerase
MKTDLFDFELPQERIATHPVSPRDSARLLAVGHVAMQDREVRELPDLLRPGDLMVMNDTRVIPTRLKGRRGQANIEVMLHKHKGDGLWQAFARPGKRLKIGDIIIFDSEFSGEVTHKYEDGGIDLLWNSNNWREYVMRHGQMPLPPYIRRHEEEADKADYQTIFARNDGAVAAPTAGLHFTSELLARLDARGIEQVRLTLHVGAGTFMPVKVDNTEHHKMHSEYYEISEETAAKVNQASEGGRRIVAVGTTSLRALESAASNRGVIAPGKADTEIFITPGYRFKAVDVLMTNFHLPRSTLFMLVSAFAGLERMKEAYRHAIEAGYRFYSYGDACLLEKNENI